MATVKDIVTVLQQKQEYLTGPLGVDVWQANSTELRAAMLELLIFTGGLMKALDDKGVISLGEIDTAINSTLNDNWPPTPLEPPGA